MIVQAHGIASNMPSAGAAGDGIHVGIIDSAWELPDQFTQGYRVHERASNSFLPTAAKETNSHAGDVFGRASSYAPSAEFTLYQAMEEDSSLPLVAYSEAIDQVIADGVDIVNLSAGDPWRAAVEDNPNVHETRRLIEEGITVVAAAGNYNPDEHDSRPPVHCPAAVDEVVSVGSYLTRCPADAGDESSDKEEGPYHWVTDGVDLDSEVVPLEDVYCGERGCINGESCFGKQHAVEWEYNVLPTGGKPDVFAPTNIMREHTDEGCFMGAGTSFSAPLVTGSLACMFSEIRENGDDLPAPYEVREAVRAGSTGLEGRSRAGKYDAMGVRKNLDIIEGDLSW